MVRVIHGFSSCHRVAQASMSGRNLVFKKRPRRQYEIAPVGDRVQLLHDRGHVLAHEAEDVVTEVGMVPARGVV